MVNVLQSCIARETLLLLVLALGSVEAQSGQSGMFVQAGVALQNDVGIKGPDGIRRFQLSPVGFTAGFGATAFGPGSSSFDLAVRASFYPLISSTSITPASGGQAAGKRTALVTGSVSASWRPSRSADWPWFLEGGLARSFQSPRNDIRNSLLVGTGFSRHIRDRLRGDVAIELLVPKIGTTVVQLPVALTLYF